MDGKIEGKTQGRSDRGRIGLIHGSPARLKITWRVTLLSRAQMESPYICHF